MFSFGAKMTPPKVMQIPYIPHMRENNVRTGYFEFDEYVTLKNALPDYLRPVVTMAPRWPPKIPHLWPLENPPPTGHL